VHACLNKVKVPSTHTPNFTVLPSVNMVPINNGISALDKAYAGYVVIGNGKTGIDAVLHLLNQGVCSLDCEQRCIVLQPRNVYA